MANVSQNHIVPLEAVATIKYINTPTVVDHYQLRRVFDVYIMPKTEDLGRVGTQIQHLLNGIHPPHGTLITLGGSVTDMHQAFRSFALGLALAVVLIYLVLMAQFASFSDPFVILLAVPPGIAGVVLTLLVTGSSLNIMSLMGLLMMTGMAVSNSILIVEFVGKQREEGKPLKVALTEACRFRLRPILMTTLATVLGIIPMSLGLEAGSEQYAPLARALLGGVLVSAVVSVFLVPTVYFLIHRNDENAGTEPAAQPNWRDSHDESDYDLAGGLHVACVCWPWSSPAALAQKLADAPSAVMLAKNIQQQDSKASPVAPHASACRAMTLSQTSPPDTASRIRQRRSHGELRFQQQLTLHEQSRLRSATILGYVCAAAGTGAASGLSPNAFRLFAATAGGRGGRPGK